ncbi:membrane hypothetical protein [Frankia sp. AiPs1]|uniref:hypothetical protein n=1 Tax=Frankia sp. AiPa1 TaxID=573492 RepID=UPI00202B7DAC|nr:hypothetical protein [Frankia sp. AiPa1]MCL9761001.1 hypothetical protein [Frankia sp. AiPa1]
MTSHPPTDRPPGADPSDPSDPPDPAGRHDHVRHDPPRPHAATRAVTAVRAAARVRVVVAAAGLAVAGYGIAGLMTHPRATHPAHTLRWLLGGLLGHDVLVAPAAAVLGVLLSRLVAHPYRSVVQAASFVSASIALASFPLWSGRVGHPANPSVDPLPYGRNLLTVLGAIWSVAAAVMLRRAVRARRSTDRPGRSPR